MAYKIKTNKNFDELVQYFERKIALNKYVKVDGKWRELKFDYDSQKKTMRFYIKPFIFRVKFFYAATELFIEARDLESQGVLIYRFRLLRWLKKLGLLQYLGYIIFLLLVMGFTNQSINFLLFIFLVWCPLSYYLLDEFAFNLENSDNKVVLDRFKILLNEIERTQL